MTPEDFNKVEEYIKDTWFKDHIATYEKTLKNVEFISWANPKRSAYRVDYIRDSYLHVTGDIGYAIYCSGFNSLKEWSGCDFGYFASKCVASENGNLYYEWDSDFLRERVIENLQIYNTSDEDVETNNVWNNFQTKGGIASMNTEIEWCLWLDRYGDEFFGHDRYCWPTDGKRIAVRCKGHLIGLKMAIESLNKKGVLL